MLKISKELFTAWNDAKLLYCHWKSNEHLLPGLDGETDLDVLLSRDYQKEGESILRRLKFLQVRSQFGSRYPNVDDWIGFDYDTGKLIHIHLHYDLITGHRGMKEYTLHWTDMALRTRILNDEYGVYTMEPNLEMVTLYTRIGLKADFKSLIRCRLGRFKFSKNTQREIDWLKERVDKGKVYHLVNTFYGRKGKDMQRIMECKKITNTDLLKLRKLTEIRFREMSRVKYFMRVRELLYFLYLNWGKRIVSKFHPVITRKVPYSGAGNKIVFVGQDGSGKSTVTNEIIKWLSWKLDATRFYFGSGDYFNPWQKKLRKGLRKFSRLPVCNYLYKMTTLWVLSLWGKYVRKNIKMVNRYVAKGGIAILDRFPQMQYAGINDGPKIRKWSEKESSGWILKYIANRLAKREEKDIEYVWSNTPDVVFKLVLPVEESFRRKPHENRDAVRCKHDVIENLEFDNTKVYTIDATQNYEKEIIEIKRNIWSQLVK